MERTRGAIIQAFAELLDEKPISKITVKDIVGRCNLNRNTFYYHFEGIPTLVEQIMEEKADELIQNYFQPGEPIECLRPLIQYCIRNKNAVLHVYRYVPRETFLTYVNRIALGTVQNYFANLTTDDPAPDETVAALIQFYKCAIVGLMLDWLEGGMKEDMMALTKRLCGLLHGTCQSALNR